jgi:hypothetical protein
VPEASPVLVSASLGSYRSVMRDIHIGADSACGGWCILWIWQTGWNRRTTLRLRMEPPRRAGLCPAGRSIRRHRALRTGDRPAVGRCRRFSPLVPSHLAADPQDLAACDRNDALGKSSMERRQRRTGRHAKSPPPVGAVACPHPLGIRPPRQDRERRCRRLAATGRPSLAGALLSYQERRHGTKRRRSWRDAAVAVLASPPTLSLDTM